MRLKSDLDSYEAFFNTVSAFHRQMAGRRVVVFDEKYPGDGGDAGYFIRYLLGAKFVVEDRIAEDRNLLLSVLSLAIGPQYFSPADFWDYENSQRFSLNASTEAVVQNLTLLDEFCAAKAE